MSEKQDKIYPRTAVTLAQQYNFGKSFAETMGIATDARQTANAAKQAVNDMFANDITMTGKFMSSAMTYLPPTYDNAMNTLWAALFPDEYPLPEGYDFDLNGDGVFDEEDAVLALKVYQGDIAMKDCPGAVKTKATIHIDMSDPQKLIHIFGENMWGTYVETFIGADANNCSFASRDYLKRMINQEVGESNLYRIVDGEIEYINPPMEIGVEYRTAERHNGKPVYVKKVDLGALPNTSENVVPHFVSPLVTVVDSTGIAKSASGDFEQFPVVTESGDIGAKIRITPTSVTVRSFTDLSSYTGEATIWYTKS